MTKYTALKQSNEGSKYVSEEESLERMHREEPRSRWKGSLISDDPEQSLQKLASIVDISKPTMRRIAKENLRFKSYTLKIRQMLSEAARTSRIARLESHSGLPTA